MAAVWGVHLVDRVRDGFCKNAAPLDFNMPWKEAIVRESNKVTGGSPVSGRAFAALGHTTERFAGPLS